MKRISTLLLALALQLGALAPLQAQNWDFIKKLGSSDQQPGDNLGISVAISDSFLVAGAWWADLVIDPIGFISSPGAVYSYKLQPNGTWVEMQKLISIAPEALGYFGYYVEIFEDHLLVGAINEDHSGLQDAGKVYAYHLDVDDQWVLDDVLMADEPGNGDYFGTNLGFYGDYAFIGAPYHDYDEQGNNFLAQAGAAYIFKRQPNNQWQQVRKLVATDREEDNFLGKNVDIGNRGLIFGAYKKDLGFSPLECGAAYGIYFDDLQTLNFDNVTSADLDKITPADQQNFESFGWDVAISGRWAVAGKSGETDQPGGGSGSGTGAAYFFYWENGQWVEKQKVYASDFSDFGRFGRAISIDGPICVIGSGTESEDENGQNFVSAAGAAYIFELQPNQQWQEVRKITGTQRNIGDLFGEDAIDLSGTNLVVGAWLADTIDGTVVTDGGAVYVYTRDAPLISTREIPLLKHISILNNPSSGLLQLRNDSGESYPAAVSVFSLEGRTQFQTSIEFGPSWQRDLSGLPTGIYLVQVRREGYLPQSWKWVKL